MSLKKKGNDGNPWLEESNVKIATDYFDYADFLDHISGTPSAIVVCDSFCFRSA
jgi:hypothetical protein